MLSERIVSGALRVLNKQYLHQEPVDLESVPVPRPGHGYVLYAHVPFCERLCLYCSFNRYLFQEQRAREYFKRLRREMHMVADLGYDFPSLYIGGGTPTILLDELAETIDLARGLFSIEEVSCETSPNHLGPELVSVLKERVQRLSVGIQSFDDGILRQVDRYDKYGSGEEIFRHINSVAGQFHSLNVDLIFNFPSQTEEMLARDIELLKESGANQTTFYPLMASPRTRAELARQVGHIDYAREAVYYRIIAESLSPDFQPTSAWTYSRETDAMIDEYIVDYGEYVGVGSGALSFLDGRIFGNTFSLRDYIARIDAGQMSVAKAGNPYSKKAMRRYRFVTDLFGLKLDKRRFERDFGIPVERGLAAELAFMRAAGGIAGDDGEFITLTEKGRYLLMVMMRETLATSNDLRDHARDELPPDERMLLIEAEPCSVPRTEPQRAAAV
ncbi:MAG: coproporphyrinogen III oxidase family protein [Anaerosomatales bacterium]|nr:coproporphyrinogen III oxidase family protein [Anaerosomatales bacterium]MDT8433590.1 coproporphyrinogen III oxidase family protein [Anaerosomatales bacterium]